MAKEKENKAKDTTNKSTKDSAETAAEVKKEVEAPHPTLQKKRERREAKAARKEANKVEEKKSRPNNILLAILIFGILIAMFAFVGGYNYMQKPANIEKYMEDSGLGELYKEFSYGEHTKAKITADGNTLNILFELDDEVGEDEKKQFEGEEGLENLKNIASDFLTSVKPQVRGFGAKVEASAVQGDDTLNSVSMTYKEAKKFLEDAIEKAKKEAKEAGEEAEAADEDAEEEEEGSEGSNDSKE